MTPFGASSRSGRGQLNNDGSSSVYCYMCREFIATSFTRINRALCEVCRRAEAGELMTEEAINAYRASKQGRSDVGLILVPEEPPRAPGVPKKKFSLRSMTGEVLQAMGKFVLGQPADAAKAVESTRLATSKKRKRLFENVDLGSMEEVDQAIKPKK